MIKFVMNLSEEEFHDKIFKKDFVNKDMSYSLTKVVLPNGRIMVSILMSFFSLTPSILSIKEYLNLDASVFANDDIDINQRLVITNINDEQNFVSHTWMPSLADYSLAEIFNQECFDQYINHIVNELPPSDKRLLGYKSGLEGVVHTLDYDLSRHQFDILTRGMDLILSSHGKKTHKLLTDKIYMIFGLQNQLQQITKLSGE